jgi:hypothetical protein
MAERSSPLNGETWVLPHGTHYSVEEVLVLPTGIMDTVLENARNTTVRRYR